MRGGSAFGEEHRPGLSAGDQLGQEPGGGSLEVQEMNVLVLDACPCLPAGQVKVGHVQSEGILGASDATDDVNRLLDLDTQTYLPEDILVKVDIASMAHALEVRAPLLDHVLVEWMAGLPGDLKLRDIRGKRVLRHIARDLVPREILVRRKKGFSLPVDRWFREELRPLARDLLTDRICRERGILDPGGVARLLDAHDRGEDHGERLWNLLVLEMWFREQGSAADVVRWDAHAGVDRRA